MRILAGTFLLCVCVCVCVCGCGWVGVQRCAHDANDRVCAVLYHPYCILLLLLIRTTYTFTVGHIDYRYVAPVPEFELQRTELSAAAGVYTLPAVGAATIWVVIDGEGLVTTEAQVAGGGGGSSCSSKGDDSTVLIECGQVWLQEAHAKVMLQTDRSIVLFRATAGMTVAH
jgi:hypothetical protein